jgi:hypothetical protein
MVLHIKINKENTCRWVWNGIWHEIDGRDQVPHLETEGSGVCCNVVFGCIDAWRCKGSQGECRESCCALKKLGNGGRCIEKSEMNLNEAEMVQTSKNSHSLGIFHENVILTEILVSSPTKQSTCHHQQLHQWSNQTNIHVSSTPSRNFVDNTLLQKNWTPRHDPARPKISW